MKCILASRLDLYNKNNGRIKTAKNFGNKNCILDNIKKYVKKYDNFLFVVSNEFNSESNDFYAGITFKSFDLTLPFKSYYLLDSRTENNIDELISKSDLIFLSGGHLPTQNKFFNNINLKEKIRNTNAFIIGGSAGAMNMAHNVYSIPELECESLNPNFEKNLKGLSLIDINILPHYDVFKDAILDGKRFIEDIVLPDTYGRQIYALNNGSYILMDREIYLYGEAYLLRNGKSEKINDENEIKIIRKLYL